MSQFINAVLCSNTIKRRTPELNRMGDQLKVEIAELKTIASQFSREKKALKDLYRTCTGKELNI